MNNLPPTKTVPDAAEAEAALLGSILIESYSQRSDGTHGTPYSLDTARVFLFSEDFFIFRNRCVWDAMISVTDRCEDVNNLSVGEELKRQGKLSEIGGMAYLTQLMNSTPNHTSAETFARMVEAASILRRLLKAGLKICDIAVDGKGTLAERVQEAETALFAVTRVAAPQEMTSVQDAIAQYYDVVEQRNTDPTTRQGMNTGLTQIDNTLGGLGKSRLIILAGRPGEGKTSLALYLTMLLSHAQKRVAFFSYEMSKEEIVNRMAAAVSCINDRKIANGTLDEREWGTFTEAAHKISKWSGLRLSENADLNIRQLRVEARKMQQEGGLDLVVVDYLQLVPSGAKVKDENRNIEVGRITRELKKMAMELKVPVLALSQLNRAVEQRADREPNLSDLRDSGEIEAHANQVAFIYPIADNSSNVWIKIDKNRHGPKERFQLGFNRPINQFTTVGHTGNNTTISR